MVGMQVLLQVLLLNESNISLACGLFAFIGLNPDKYFSWDKFTILGLFNDSRGGDSCGRVIGDMCQHGTGALDTYKKFNILAPRPRVKDFPFVVLGHCRKASSGGRNDLYAQPIILRRKDVNMKAFKDTHLKKAIKELDPETIICSGIHNGTIDNYKELAPRYGIPIEDHNDSKVLLNALFYGNFSILSEYIGTASLIWQNHITGKSFVFRGVSKLSASAGVFSEERPLYYYEVGKENYYISSMEDSLRSIGATEKAVKEVPANVVMIFKNGDKFSEIKIDREKAHQGRYDYSKSSKKHSGVNNRNYMNDNDVDDIFYRDGFYHGYPVQITPSAKKSQLALMWTPDKEKDKNPKIKHSVIAGDNKHPFVRCFDDCIEPFRLQSEISDSYTSKIIRKVVYNKGRYWLNGSLMHGIYLLNAVGMIPSRITIDSSILKTYCFVEGVLLDGITSYNKVIGIHENFINVVTNNICALVEEEQRFTADIARFSRYPVVSLTATTGEQDCLSSNSVKENNFFDGSFNPLFSDREYFFINGDLQNIKIAKNGVRIADHDDSDSEIADTYLTTCKNDPTKTDTFKIGSKLLYIGGIDNPFSPFQNIMFTFCDMNDELEIQLMLAHYLKDFRNEVKTSCSLCLSKSLNLLGNCRVCKDSVSEMKKICKEVDYAVFK